MRQCLTSADLFANVMLLRSGTNAALIIVEGSSDSRTLTPHIDASNTRIVVGFSKPAVEETLALCDTNSIPSVVALVDSDLENFTDAPGIVRSPNLVRTENYDLEADVFFAPGLSDRLIYAHVDRDHISQQMKAVGVNNIETWVTTLAAKFGSLRLTSAKNRLNLHLRELPLGNFVTIEDGLDIQRLSAAIRQKSRHTTLTVPEISKLLNEALEAATYDRRMSCGHDILNIICGVLRRWSSNRVSYYGLSVTLRAALSRADLETLQVYADLQAWAQRTGNSIWARSA